MTSLDQEPEQGGGREPAERSSTPCPIVGIGASAGGLEAFQAFFSDMPADSGMAFVLVQHLDARHETLMPELLQKHTPMPVILVTEDTPIGTDRIYVAAPRTTVTVDDCVLRVAPQEGGTRNMPIDRFFRSLAEDQGEDAVGIVLTGTGSDGSLGIRAIREHGGLTLVQAPASALFDGMPRSAILTGLVDEVLPVEEMPGRLLRHLGSLRERAGGGLEEGRRDLEGHLAPICALLRQRTGHDFGRYKQSTMVRRLRRRMGDLRTDSAEAYLRLLRDDPEEVDRLFRVLLIGITHFFRDPEAFAALQLKIIPRLFERKGTDEQVRVWVPGCSTGEEAWSLAILLREHMDNLQVPPHVQIFATDVDPQALETARQGWYPERVSEQVPPERLRRFFHRHGNMFQVSREIREMCLFSTHNLVTDPPFSRLDLISCRNLLIYLEPELQKRLIPLCHYALRSGGYLFLGPSESVGSNPELFRAVDKRLRIFQARDVVVRPPLSFPMVERSRHFATRPGLASPRSLPDSRNLTQTIERILLEHYSPACVLVDERGEIAYFSPRTGRYLEIPAGSPRLNVLEMAKPGLRLDLRTALHRAVTARALISHEAVPFEADGHAQRIHLSVRPLFEMGEDSGYYLVVFQDVRDDRPAAAGANGDGAGIPPASPDAAATIQRLEAELRNTRDHLHAVLEELESSNEELVSSNEELLSINEELQSTNEELQTSKEELQSVNEELETINAELRKKVEELNRANGDLQNLFQSTRIATIFVGRDLRIQRFTPAATEVFRLIDSDVGRRIEDIAPRFSEDGAGDIARDIRNVLRSLQPLERQVRLRDEDTWFILRLLPYRTVEDLIDGVVVTFLDVTELKRAEQHRARLAAIVESSHDAVIGKTLDGTVVSWNGGAERLYGYTSQEAVGRNITFLAPRERIGELTPIFDKLRQGERVPPFETERVRKDGTRLDILLTVSPVFDGEGRIVEASAIAHDITALKRTEEALREASRRKDEFLAMLGHELRNPLASIRSSLLVLEQPGLAAGQAGRVRQTLDRQVQHLTRLVDDLLDVSRVSQGKILLRRETLDLTVLMRDTVQDHRAAAERAGQTLTLDQPDRPLWVDADPTRLAQCVGNVLHNALKFTEAGGRVAVTVGEGDGQAVISVQDDGLGMEPESQERVFEPFAQADSGIDRSRGGLGLGLALVKRLVELHGGTVRARSEGIGKGTEVEIRLPLAEPPAARPAPAPAAPPAVRRPRRCLIVEDNADAAESMGLLLELSGHEVRIASDGLEGLEAARSFRPDVVLCDIGLPNGLDGYEVARRMRQDPELRGAVLIALTGYGQLEDQRRAREAGFDVHLTKPADPDRLKRLLEETGEP